MFVIHGGKPLRGCVAASGSKNAALPIMASAILAEGPVELHRVPRLADVDTLSTVLQSLGLSVERRGDRLQLETIDDTPRRADYRYVRRMRGSFCVLGPLVARRGSAMVSLPGGCSIGDRPVDLHLRGLAELGADVRLSAGYCVVTAKRLRGATIDLLGPRGPSVTATANILSAATLARGRTVIKDAAREPEIVDLGRFLIGLGARIDGLGTSTIEVVGVESLGSARHTLIADRVETATLLLAGAITGGSVVVDQCEPTHLDAVLQLLEFAGVTIERSPHQVRLDAPHRLSAFNADAQPYPEVPTDVQAQLMAMATIAAGRSTISDHVFPERFAHTAELRRLGARIVRSQHSATTDGVDHLVGAPVVASDLRASAALVLAGLAARGCTTIARVHHLDRGYERLDAKLRTLGAHVEDTRLVTDRRETTFETVGSYST